MKHPVFPVLQEQFYQLWESAPESAMYNSGFSAFLHGGVDTTALEAALHMLCQRQEVSSQAACSWQRHRRRLHTSCTHCLVPCAHPITCTSAPAQVLRTRYVKGQQGVVQRVLPLASDSGILRAVEAPAAVAGDIMQAAGRCAIVAGAHTLPV